MSNNSAALRIFFRRGAALGALALAMGTAVAQTPQQAQPTQPAGTDTVEQTRPAQQAEAESADRVVVTGSRIARDAFTSSAPITVITAEAAQLEGLIDTAEILQGSTIASGSVQYNNQFGGFVVEGGPGINSVSLRGLGAQRSLVLLNGRRPGPAGVRGQVGSFDLQVIPDSIISRVEILKDGASSIYGSDAVAGVANIITRSSIAKPELSIQYNLPTDTGAESLQINGAVGYNFDFGGSLMLAAEYESRGDLQAGERDWSACAKDLVFDPASDTLIDRLDRSILGGTALGGCSSTNIYFNTVIDAFTGARYVPSPNGVTTGPIPGYRPRANQNYSTTNPAQVAFFEDVLNSSKYLTTDILAGVDRASVYGKFDMDLAGAKWSTEALFTRREYESNRWRQFFPLIGTNPGGPICGVPSLAQYCYQQASTFPLNEFFLTQPVTIWPFNSWVNVDYTYVGTGLSGEFGDGGLLSNFTWQIDANYSLSDGEYIGNQILVENAGDLNYVSANGLRVGPKYNPYDPAFLSGNYSQAVYDLLSSNERGTTEYEQYSLSAVVSGDLIDLPAGPLGIAAGAEYRSFSILDTPSKNTQERKLWGFSAAGVTEGTDTVREVFVEVDAPVLKGAPFVEELSINASTRFFDYDSYGSDSVWKAGFNWQVVPAVRVRGTKGTSYRAPALYELYLGDQTSFVSQTSIDPCIDWQNSSNEFIRANCAAAGVPSNYTGVGSSATVYTGGGLGVLNAETSEATTLGVIFTPDFIDFSFAVDYFDITINDQVSQLGSSAIVFGCYGRDTYPNQFCNLFTRLPSTDGSRPNQISEVFDSYVNVNQQTTSGLDFSARYEHEFSFGDLTVDLNATHTFEDVNLLFAPSQVSGFNTNDFNGTIGDPKWVGDAQFSLRRGDFTYSWFVDYVGPTDNSPFSARFFTYLNRPARRINTTDAVLTHDMSVRYRGDNFTVTGGVANIFDEQPPLVSTGASRLGTAPIFGTQYDLRGRTLFLRLGASF